MEFLSIVIQIQGVFGAAAKFPTAMFYIEIGCFIKIESGINSECVTPMAPLNAIHNGPSDLPTRFSHSFTGSGYCFFASGARTIWPTYTIILLYKEVFGACSAMKTKPGGTSKQNAQRYREVD